MVSGSIPSSANFYSVTDDSHCNRIHSSLIPDNCLDNGYVRKQPEAWKEYCTKYQEKELKEGMDQSYLRANKDGVLDKTAFLQVGSASWDMTRLAS